MIITGSGGFKTREVLASFQFATSVFLITGTIVIFSQLRHNNGRQSLDGDISGEIS